MILFYTGSVSSMYDGPVTTDDRTSLQIHTGLLQGKETAQSMYSTVVFGDRVLTADHVFEWCEA